MSYLATFLPTAWQQRILAGDKQISVVQARRALLRQNLHDAIDKAEDIDDPELKSLLHAIVALLQT